MSEVTIDANVAQGIVQMLGQLQLDYQTSKARNLMIDHVGAALQALETKQETQDG